MATARFRRSFTLTLRVRQVLFTHRIEEHRRCPEVLARAHDVNHRLGDAALTQRFGEDARPGAPKNRNLRDTVTPVGDPIGELRDTDVRAP